MEKVKKRNPVIALVFSIISIGLGQIYNGQLVKGIIIFIGAVLLSLLNFALVRISFLCLYAGIMIGIFYMVVAIIDSIRNAIKNTDYTLKRFNRWYVYLMFFLLSIISSNLILSLNPYQSCRALGDSMLPNLEDGDRVLIDQRYYDFKNSFPMRGDIVLFETPSHEGALFLKRVVAVEGETLVINKSGIYINDLPIMKNWLFYGEENGGLDLYGEGKWLVPDN